MKKAIAAIFILVFALAGGISPASAEPGWGRGRGRGRSYGRSRGRGRGWGYNDYNPLPEIFGGIVGGWLGSQMRPDPEPPRSPFAPEEEEEDDGPR
jgi:hypothetical protein